MVIPKASFLFCLKLLIKICKKRPILSLPDDLLWLLYDFGQSVVVNGIRLDQNKVFQGKQKNMLKMQIHYLEKDLFIQQKTPQA